MYLLICSASNDTNFIFMKFLNYCFISSQTDVNSESTLMDSFSLFRVKEWKILLWDSLKELTNLF